MTRLNLRCFIALVLFASLSACAATQPPAPISAPLPTAVFVPPPSQNLPAPQPSLAPAPPVYVAPDYTTLEGHSSYTTPVPVEPVDIEEMGPVIGE